MNSKDITDEEIEAYKKVKHYLCSECKDFIDFLTITKEAEQ